MNPDLARIPPGLGDWFLGELLDGAGESMAGHPIGKAHEAAVKVRDALEDERSRKCLRIGLWSAVLMLERLDRNMSAAAVGAELLEGALRAAVKGDE